MNSFADRLAAHGAVDWHPARIHHPHLAYAGEPRVLKLVRASLPLRTAGREAQALARFTMQPESLDLAPMGTTQHGRAQEQDEKNTHSTSLWTNTKV